MLVIQFAETLNLDAQYAMTPTRIQVEAMRAHNLVFYPLVKQSHEVLLILALINIKIFDIEFFKPIST